MTNGDPLSRRERQLMDLVYAGAPITAREIHEALPDAPSYSTVRKLLSVLIEKGELKATLVGRALVYQPTQPRKRAAQSAMRRLVDTFFNGSVTEAVTGLIDLNEAQLTPEEMTALRAKIETQAKDQINSRKP